MSIAQDIKSRLDIVDIVSDYVDLRKSGRNYSGFCPFHPNSRTPAFFVSPERQSWHCYGACAEGGDLFSFVMKKEGWDFKEALKAMAQRAGVELPEYRPKSADQQEVEDRLGNLLADAADYFHQLLLYAPEAEAARRYLQGRDLSAETIETFKLGYALNRWDACLTHFMAQGYSREELLEVGILTHNEESDRIYDRFRNRVIFPIWDINDRVVGFGARTLEKDGIPKYLNSPQTTLFDKSRLLYGLNFAKRHVREARQAVIVEGYMDVIRAHQTGFQNVIAQMGTALTEAQLQTLKRYTKRFVIALDSDEAGARATMRSLAVARETLDRTTEVRFDARGLLRHEGRLQADIRVATMPVGQDPDDLIRANPAKWASLTGKAKPIVEYVIGVLSAEIDPTNAKAKSTIARQIIPLIRDIADPIERDHYWQMLSRTLKIDERTLRRFIPQKKQKAKQAIKVQSKARPSNELHYKFIAPRITHQLEANFLRQSAAYPAIMVQIDQQLQQNQQPIVKKSDFTTSEDQALWTHLRRRAQQHQQTIVSIEELCDSLDDVLKGRMIKVLQLAETPSDQVEKLPSQLAQSVLNWRFDKIRKQLSDVKQLLAFAKEHHDLESAEEHTYTCQALSMEMYLINRAQHAMTASSQRLRE